MLMDKSSSKKRKKSSERRRSSNSSSEDDDNKTKRRLKENKAETCSKHSAYSISTSHRGECKGSKSETSKKGVSLKTKRKYSSSESSSSSTSESKQDRKRSKKHKKKEKKQRKEKKRKKDKRKKKKRKRMGKVDEHCADRNEDAVSGPMPAPQSEAPIEKVPLKRRAMVPMTKEEYEIQQSKVRRVFDPETGRNRLVKGDGEIIEEVVSYHRHKEINKLATLGDGASFQQSLGLHK